MKKIIWDNLQRILELFTQKIVIKPSKIWVWDPGSGKNLFRIPDPGVKKAPDPGTGSATLRIQVYRTKTVYNICLVVYLVQLYCKSFLRHIFYRCFSAQLWLKKSKEIWQSLTYFDNRARIFLRLWSPGIDSKEWIPPAYVAWRAGTITLFLLLSYPP